MEKSEVPNIIGSSLSKEDEEKQFIFLVMEYLQKVKGESRLNEDAVESLEVACQCLTNAFGVSLENEEQKKKYSIGNQSAPSVLQLGLTRRDKFEDALEQIRKKQSAVGDQDDAEFKFYKYLQAIRRRGGFSGAVGPIGSEEYEKRYAKARQTFLERGLKEADLAKVKKEVSEADIQEAEKLKNEGNNMLSSKQYEKAVSCYTKAIELNPNNAIYYANRAAAYSHLGLYQQSVDDCLISIRINPNYSKAYSRLGLAYFNMDKFKESVEQYQKAVDLEPNNQTLKDCLIAAQKRLQAEPETKPALPTFPKQSPPTTTLPTTTSPSVPFTNPASGGTPPVPNLQNLQQMFNNPEVMNSMNNMFGTEGMGGLGNILSNPMFQNFAQQMLSNPQFMSMASNLMSNPDALNNVMSTLKDNTKKG